jgi:allantoate deiminase
MDRISAAARDAITRCLSLAECTEEPGFTTRSFLSAPMHEVHERLGAWMRHTGMIVSIDAVGNIRGCYPATEPSARRLLIGSHLDTVPRAGAYDGILGVVLGIGLVELLDKRALPFQIEVVGFSEEEGLRFGVPFIGSRALIGEIDDELLGRRDAKGISVRDAIREFGLDPSRIGEARAESDALGYVEFHIEQGPVLESLGYSVSVVEAIAGQSRHAVTFTGQANHAGTTPMHLRHDTLAGAAEWILFVERHAREVPGLVATVGRIHAEPDAANVIPGVVTVSLDVRHATDTVRKNAVDLFQRQADSIAQQRGLKASWKEHHNQPAVAMDPSLTQMLDRALADSGHPAHRMISGAGHDAMVIARALPTAMLFLRTPGGLSHHSKEDVLADDVTAALRVGSSFLSALEARHG